jgi:hypothetical protein
VVRGPPLDWVFRPYWCPSPTGDDAAMFESVWILWIAAACVALVALAVLAGRYAAGLFMDATTPSSKIDPRAADHAM